jgi:hypothetical protein
MRAALVIAVGFALAATASAQLPTVEAFLTEPLHSARGRLPSASVGDPDPRLGVELTVPLSIEAGSFDVLRDRFERHPVILPAVRFTWTHGRAIDDQLVRHDRTEYGRWPDETRGEGWVALIQWPGADVQVVVRHVTPRGELDCVGSGGSDVVEANADRVRDWLLARCRSVRFVPLP